MKLIAALLVVLMLLCGSVWAQPTVPEKMASEVKGAIIPESGADRDYSKPTMTISPVNFTIIQQAAEEFFAPAPDGSCVPRSLFAEVIPANLSQYYVLDVRGPEDYSAGHIPGATNIVVTEVFKMENLAKLPMDKPILVVCNSGTSGAMSTSVLNLLGYDAWQLRFGMMSWPEKTPSAVWSMNPAYLQDIIGGNFSMEK
jgi:rhodanese-related sulfurtransferase